MLRHPVPVLERFQSEKVVLFHFENSPACRVSEGAPGVADATCRRVRRNCHRGASVSKAEIKRLDVQPYFDMESYLGLCQETRLGGDLYEKLATLWDKWLAELNVHEIKAGGTSALAVWLPEEVENEVDSLFDESPSQGFMINNLAQYMCMATIAELLPMVEQAGCAPSPEPTLALAKALKEAGLGCNFGEALLPERRYATVTHYPFKGGCEVCSLKDNCPKGKNFSMVIPGHEPEPKGAL